MNKELLNLYLNFNFSNKINLHLLNFKYKIVINIFKF